MASKVFNGQFPIRDVDDAVFDRAAIVLRTTHDFAATPSAVWSALDGDQAWTWLPFGCGVEYDEPVRRVGMERGMGCVTAPWRFIWIQRERFWRYEPGSRITYSAYSASWPLLHEWAENYTLIPNPAGGTRIEWTVALTPRFVSWLPLTWLQPPLRMIFTLGFRPGMRRLIARTADPEAGS